jgi:hypothetical protein
MRACLVAQPAVCAVLQQRSHARGVAKPGGVVQRGAPLLRAVKPWAKADTSAQSIIM